MAMLYYAGYNGSIAAIASPWIAHSFGLDQSAIAAVFAWLALSALGSLGLSRMADRAGRRRVLLWSAAAIPLCSLGAALSTKLALFVIFEIALGSFAGAAGASSIVMLAEALPIARRAQGQSFGGLAATLGAGLCVMLMPAVVALGISWRWLLVLSTVGIALLPWLARALAESGRWERAAKAGDSSRSRFHDVFVSLYRRRTIALMTCGLMGAIAGEGISTWGYFHAVSVVGLSAGVASVMTLVGGGLGMLGFPIGAWAAERFGRVPTVVISGGAVAAGGLCFYWGPPAHFGWPILWLCAAFLFLNAASNVSTVASNAAITELFPTALRGTIIGWLSLVGAAGSLSAEATISLLARPLGGLSTVVGWLGLLAVPGAILFGIVMDETRGLSLEDAGKEAAFRARER